LGDHLIINGDLFEFWFEYRSVVQREHFATLTALARLRDSGVRITLTGGNHDRWGLGFWESELKLEFHRGSVQKELAGLKSWVVHGDGLTELRRSGRITHAVCSHPLTAQVFRLLHPDIGFGVVRRIRRFICAPRDDDTVTARAAAAQAEYARRFLRENLEIDLLVMGHTHVPALELVGENQWYLNPGAWMGDYRYAVISSERPELRSFADSGSGERKSDSNPQPQAAPR
jgi:UDP-2,3-diacylglucosamine hydrolase